MISPEQVDQTANVVVKKRQYKKREPKPTAQPPTSNPIPAPEPAPKPAKRTPKPRAPKIKEESDEEQEIEKLKNILCQNKELSKEINDIINTHGNKK